MGRRQSESVDERNRRCLEAFVLRGRRVAEHSLAADWDALVELTLMRIPIVFEDGETRIRIELPPEEVIESAAARVRPILLEREDCFHMKVLAALGYFCRNAPEDQKWIQGARTEWRTRARPTTPEESGYWTIVSDTATGEEHNLDAFGLAMAWMYGDVVHHDSERRHQGDAFGLFDRFRAAVPLIAWAMVGTIELLNFIDILNKAGLLHLRQEVFTEQVTLQSTVWDEPAEMHFAPVGTKAPSLASSPYPEGWLPLDANTDMSIFSHRDERQLPGPGPSQGNRVTAGGWTDELIRRWKATQPDN